MSLVGICIARPSKCFVIGWSVKSSLGLSVLGVAVRLGGSELGNLLLDGLVNAALEFLAVPKLEEELKPNKERGQEDSLNQVVQQRRRASLESAVPDELEDPAGDVDADGGLVRQGRVLNPEVVASGSGGQANDGQQRAGDRFEKNIQTTPSQGCQCPQVEI